LKPLSLPSHQEIACTYAAELYQLAQMNFLNSLSLLDPKSALQMVLYVWGTSSNITCRNPVSMSHYLNRIGEFSLLQAALPEKTSPTRHSNHLFYQG
jgi:hypothetical protein